MAVLPSLVRPRARYASTASTASLPIDTLSAPDLRRGGDGGGEGARGGWVGWLVVEARARGAAARAPRHTTPAACKWPASSPHPPPDYSECAPEVFCGHLQRRVVLAAAVGELADTAAHGERHKHALAGLAQHLQHGQVAQREVAEAWRCGG